MSKKKMNLKKIEVQSFVTNLKNGEKDTNNIAGGVTGNCGSFIGVTCPEPCDFRSIPLNECSGYTYCNQNSCQYSCGEQTCGGGPC